jgi:Mn-dependent DtxR family transcriptional regulator
MYTGLDLVADILSFSDRTGRLKIQKIEKMLNKYSPQIPIWLNELERNDLISFDPSILEITMTVKGAEFLNLYNDLKELVCLDNNLGL